MHKVKFEIQGNEEQIKKAQDMLMNISLNHNILVEIAHKIKEDLEVPYIIPFHVSNNILIDKDFEKFFSEYSNETSKPDLDSGYMEGI